MAGEDLIAKARATLSLYNARDWNRYRTLFGEGAIYDEEATQRRVTGVDEIVKTVKSWTEGFPDVKGTEVSIHASGDTVIAEVVWEGTHQGPLFGPLASVPPTGKKGKVPAVQVIRFENGKIVEMRHYFDLMTILRQAGISLGMGAQPPAP